MSKRLIIGAVLVAIAGLVALLLIRPTAIVDRKEDRVRIQLQMVSIAMKDYAAKHGQFPTSRDGLQALVREGYFNQSALADAWDNAIRYSCIESGCQRAMVWSSGPGGIDDSGKNDDIALVVNASSDERQSSK
jgi:type II secretory pathway pseudopilin PulG